jgi:hypothetical protein
MSIVIAVANMSRVVVKSDGMVQDNITGEMIANDHEKMVNLNDNCIVGYGGTLEKCELVLNEYKKLAMESGVDLSTLKPTTVIYDLCELSKVINSDSSQISFLVAGRENNTIILYGFTSDDGYVIYNFSPDDNNHIKYITFGSDIQKNAVQYPKYYSVNHSIESSMNDYIRFISKIDESVNDHIFTRKLYL